MNLAFESSKHINIHVDCLIYVVKGPFGHQLYTNTTFYRKYFHSTIHQVNWLFCFSFESRWASNWFNERQLFHEIMIY